MRTVRNKKELEAAIKARETEIIIEGFRFKIACQVAAKLQKIKNPTFNMACGAVAESSVLTLIYVIITAMTVLAIIAMCKKYNVEIIFFEGKIKIYYNENHNQ